MSSISSISSSLSTTYSQLSSGKAINSASDGAAELAIIEEEDAQVNGLNQGSNNMAQAQDLLNVSDGALQSIQDYLQSIRELAIKASNATVSDSDKAAIQTQIDQYKQGIADIAEQTTFNTKNILDGSQTEYSLATDANGNSTSISTTNATLEALGIADFDVTGDYDISAIDDAISYVSSALSSTGAQSNALDYAMNYNSYTAYNLTSAKSRIEDLDYPQAVSEKKKQETLQAYALMMQKKKEEEEAQRTRTLLDTSFI